MTNQTVSATDTKDLSDKILPTIIFIAGFGDGAEMFTPMFETALVSRYHLLPTDLPGFAGIEALRGPTTLESLADYVHEIATREAASIVVAHSVASIIASLAARRSDSPIETILSLEGNLTAEDAYFSGTAADYANAEKFRKAFLFRLDEMAEEQPIIRRYREMVGRADAQALWELGCDARRFSEDQVPGEMLIEAADVTYFYNPKNCPPSTLRWLERNSLKTIRMDGATHWASVDQSETLAQKILEALGG